MTLHDYNPFTYEINDLEADLEEYKKHSPLICDINCQVFPKAVYDKWCEEHIHLKDKYPNIFSLKWIEIYPPEDEKEEI